MGASRSQSSWSRTCYCDDLSKVGLPQHGDAARTAQRISYSYLISFLLNLTHTTSASVQQLCLISSTPSLRAKGSVNAGDDFPFRFFIWPKLSEDNLSQNTVSYVFKARRAVLPRPPLLRNLARGEHFQPSAGSILQSVKTGVASRTPPDAHVSINDVCFSEAKSLCEHCDTIAWPYMV